MDWGERLDRLRKRFSPLSSTTTRRTITDARNAPLMPVEMFDRSIVAFDIETIPDPDIGRRLLDFKGSDAEVVHEMVKKRLEESDGKKEYPQLPWHRVACVCVTSLDPKTAKVTIRSVASVSGSDWRDERSHIEGFFRFVSELPAEPRLVSWNGSGFDLAVLRYRSMMLGIAAPGFYGNDDENRWHGYRDQHVDLMDVLSDRGGSTRVGLGTLATVMGLPGKSFLERPIYDHVLEGEAERVAEYCKLDTALTLLLFLLWSFHTNRISREDLRRYVEGVRASIAKLSEGFAGWCDVEVLLRAWPAW